VVDNGIISRCADPDMVYANQPKPRAENQRQLELHQKIDPLVSGSSGNIR